MTDSSNPPVRRNILIIAPGPVLPPVMASQTRILDMIRHLAEDHIVDLAVLISDRKDVKRYKELEGICRSVFVLQKPNHGFVARKALGVVRYLADRFGLVPMESFYPNFPTLRRKILAIAGRGGYDIVQIEYWYHGNLLSRMQSGLFKVVDTHDVLHLKRAIGLEKKGRPLSWYMKKWINAYRSRELGSLEKADMLVSISEQDSVFFRKQFPGKHHLTVPMGTEISAEAPRSQTDGRFVLFYGSMGSRNNEEGFWRFWRNIFPKIKCRVQTGVIVAGANPPAEIRRLHNGRDIIVTGYVRDIAEQLSRADVAVLPLEGGSGFRSRVVEIMKCGVPVVGTHNALDSVNLTHGLHGYISDNDDEITSFTVELLENEKKRRKMGNACRKFVGEQYSIQNTYHKLSSYYQRLRASGTADSPFSSGEGSGLGMNRRMSHRGNTFRAFLESGKRPKNGSVAETETVPLDQN
jgi:glycosyltransferase involved in cell wall biosynthesis